MSPEHARVAAAIDRARRWRLGMFHEAVRRWPDLELTQSVMIGDAPSDAEAATAAGVTAIHIGTEFPDLLTAVREAISFADHDES
jgi:histidinol phosphatase-like enzyme